MKFRTALAGIAAAGTLAAGLVAAAPAPPAAAYTCAMSARWPVKTGADADRYKVSPTVWRTGVGYLGSRRRPSSLGSYAQDHRTRWPEFHIWQVRATLVAVTLMHDGDYHLRLRANGHDMIAEIPKPGCVSSKSLWKHRIAASRNWINARFHVSSYRWTYVYRTVRVRGLGFFDDEHNVAGAAPNYFELHPVTRIAYP